MKEISKAVKALTDRTGLSQADIARLLGVPRQTFNGWLCGRLTCRHKQMLALALEALGKRLEVKK